MLFANFQKTLLLACITSAIFITSCSDAGQKKDGVQVLSGHYINDTYLQKTKTTPLSHIPSYCFELNFISQDSVAIFNGFEEYACAIKKSKDGNFEIINAYQGQNMPFTINKDSSITLHDTGWTHIATQSEFKKATGTSGQEWFFDEYINQQMIAGSYKVTYVFTRQKQDPATPVVFQANGDIIGLKGFSKYSLCYSGDCMGELAGPSDFNIILLQESKKNTTDAYAYSIDNKTQTISVYKLAPAVKDIKGDRKMKDKLLELKKM